MATPEPPRQRQNFLGGFKLTLEHLGRLPVTRQYPEEKRPKQPRQHGRHVLNRYEDGMEKCIGCELCAGVCPADCIYVRGLDNPPDDPVSPGERYGFIYEINFLRCIHCDLCVEACPTEAITESKMFEFSFTNRSDAIYTKEELLVDDTGMPKKLPWEDWREGDDLYTSGWMRATSPSGSADYEGQVQWSGDLGYGVRAPEAGQSGNRDDGTTGSKPLRETLERHLSPADLPAAKRGPRGAIGRMIEKAERFAPSASRKHKAKADAAYTEALTAGNTDRGKTARAVSDTLPESVGPARAAPDNADAGPDRPSSGDAGSDGGSAGQAGAGR
ncbi:MAG TPA: NADH-quinone oxidoreductase subunit NuoI [Acidimicrobiales bacterium]